ncbi:hypothetical protein BKA69DRAFT_703793 [Paraphysoderma sedebokerense]|nr:hypothetical protein BKA69DRAFT_703793 [Paraphysoderma sedebokerense]
MSVIATTHTRTSRSFSAGSSSSISKVIETRDKMLKDKSKNSTSRSLSTSVTELKSKRSSIGDSILGSSPGGRSLGDKGSDAGSAILGSENQEHDHDAASLSGKARRKSLSKEIVTSDQIRPEYLRRIQQQHNLNLLREQQQAAMTRVRRYLLSSSSSSSPSTALHPSSLSPASQTTPTLPPGSISGTERPLGDGGLEILDVYGGSSASSTEGGGSGRRRFLGGRNRERNRDRERDRERDARRSSGIERGYLNAMRTLGADLEELMIMEAIRQSIEDEERRKQKEEGEQGKQDTTGAGSSESNERDSQSNQQNQANETNDVVATPSISISVSQNASIPIPGTSSHEPASPAKPTHSQSDTPSAASNPTVQPILPSSISMSSSPTPISSTDPVSATCPVSNDSSVNSSVQSTPISEISSPQSDQGDVKLNSPLSSNTLNSNPEPNPQPPHLPPSVETSSNDSTSHPDTQESTNSQPQIPEPQSQNTKSEERGPVKDVNEVIVLGKSKNDETRQDDGVGELLDVA